ncbi:MAG: hypothetical protein B7Y74_14975 [Novosphingobium sp. 35-62-5]|nr:MAG: hypothetical protein B7Y74_14975 [Novosphingobium sp. 35-62-5]
MGAIALVALGGGALLLRRRERTATEPVFSPPVLPVAAPPPPPPPKPAHPLAPLTLDLEAVRMSASLVNATLVYRIVLTAKSDMEQIAVRADMTAAHASRPADEQLGGDDAPVLHQIAAMAAGETVVLTGELRLPLSAITPIRHGSAALFVPLVRIAVEGPLRLRRAFVVGLDESANTLRLQPFRLDLGPRVYAQVGQCELTVPQFA